MKKQYEKPSIVYTEKLEVRAVGCNINDPSRDPNDPVIVAS